MLDSQLNPELDSQLNSDAWDKYLQDYWDKQLPLLVCFGFPLDFNREAQLVSHSDNHSSAKAYPNDIDAYLQEEIAHKANLHLYIQPPLPGVHRYPFMRREKPDSPIEGSLLTSAFHMLPLLILEFPKIFTWIPLSYSNFQLLTILLIK